MQLRHWDGQSWKLGTLRYYTQTGWKSGKLRYWSGTEWLPVPEDPEES